jgi:hypothetical protein
VNAFGYLAIVGLMGSSAAALAQPDNATTAAAPEQPPPPAPPAGTVTPPPPATTTLSPVPVVPAAASEPMAPEVTEAKAIDAGKVEEIKASPAVEAAPAPAPVDGSATATVEVKAAEEDKSPFSAVVTLDHSIGTGTFVRNSGERDRARSVTESWDVRASYKFPFMDHKLSLGGRFMFDLSLTPPDTNPPRRFVPTDASVSVSDKNLYQHEASGVDVDGVVRLFLPTSWESIAVRRQWTALQVGAGFSRSFGAFDLKWSPGATKYINTSPVAMKYYDASREAVSHLANPATLGAGFGNPNFQITNSFDVGYNYGELWKFSYSLAIMNAFLYDVGHDDQYKGVNADSGAGRKDRLWPTLDATYALSDALGDKLQLPVKLELSAGITALTPAQTANNKNLMWPVFYQAFATNRAADNYGSIYFDISGTY